MTSDWETDFELRVIHSDEFEAAPLILIDADAKLVTLHAPAEAVNTLARVFEAGARCGQFEAKGQ